jgi:hypothetical protein
MRTSSEIDGNANTRVLRIWADSIYLLGRHNIRFRALSDGLRRDPDPAAPAQLGEARPDGSPAMSRAVARFIVPSGSDVVRPGAVSRRLRKMVVCPI